jgi:hypothetical protein
MNDHSDRIAARLDALSSDLVDPPPSVYTPIGTEGEMGEGETFTTPGVKPVGGVNGSQPKTEKARCTATTQAGAACKSYALGDAYGDASHLCISHARRQGLYVLGSVARRGSSVSQETAKHAGVGAKWLSEGAGGATRKRSPLAALREQLEADPEAVAEYGMRAIREGRDVRALTSILDRVYSDDVGHVDEPHSFDELARLTRSERRQLLSQLEAAGRAQPFRADAWRARLARGADARRAELATLSLEERRLLAEDLAALGS